MDLNTPELARIFRQELEDRSRRLVDGARALANDTLAAESVPDLVRDAHTIKGSAALLGYDTIREAGARLEEMWRMVSEGNVLDPELMVAMEATAGRLLATLDSGEEAEVAELVERLDSSLSRSDEATDVAPLRQPDPSSLGGLLSSLSDTLLGGATRVDTGDLYRLINRIVEVTLDAEALADLSLVSIEGADPELFRKSWRVQLERLSDSINEIQDQAVAVANVSFFDAVSTFPQFVRYLARRMGKDVRFELTGKDVQIDRQIVV